MSKPSVSEKSIGIFDSGLGGLSVLKAIRAELPKESIEYVGDCKYNPYGDKAPEFIIERALKICDFLLKKGSKAIVVACNTATAIAIPKLRETYSIPIIGIEPAIKPAVSSTQTKAVGVMATTATIHSARFQDLIRRFRKPDVRLLLQPCKGLADAIEQGRGKSPETQELLETYLRPFKEASCDKIVLGCTHYPFIAQEIQNILGNPTVELINPSYAVARELRRRLETNQLIKQDASNHFENFWVSGQPREQEAIVSRLLQHPVALKFSSDLD